MISNIKKAAVTGATGHLGINLVHALKLQGAEVSCIVRPSSRLDFLKAIIGSEDKIHPLELTDTTELVKAFAGSEVVFHTAAPTNLFLKNPIETIYKPIVDGTLSIIEACHLASIKKVIYTSSCASIGFDSKGGKFDENCWHYNAKHLQFRAKLMAEKKGDFLANKYNINFIRICPPSIIGPYFYKLTPSTKPYLDLLLGKLPFLPKLAYHVIDIRDLVKIELLLAKINPKYQRYIAAGPFVTAKILQSELKKLAINIRVPRIIFGKWGLYGLAILDYLSHHLFATPQQLTLPLVRECAESMQRLSTERLEKEIKWQPRLLSETLLDTLKWCQKYNLENLPNLSNHLL